MAMCHLPGMPSAISSPRGLCCNEKASVNPYMLSISKECLLPKGKPACGPSWVLSPSRSDGSKPEQVNATDGMFWEEHHHCVGASCLHPVYGNPDVLQKKKKLTCFHIFYKSLFRLTWKTIKGCLCDVLNSLTTKVSLCLSQLQNQSASA